MAVLRVDIPLLPQCPPQLEPLDCSSRGLGRASCSPDPGSELQDCDGFVEAGAGGVVDSAGASRSEARDWCEWP